MTWQRCCTRDWRPWKGILHHTYTIIKKDCICTIHLQMKTGHYKQRLYDNRGSVMVGFSCWWRDKEKNAKTNFLLWNEYINELVSICCTHKYRNTKKQEEVYKFKISLHYCMLNLNKPNAMLMSIIFMMHHIF